MGCCVTDYDQKLTIQKLTQASVDAHGYIDDTSDTSWVTHTDSWAKVQSRGGREFWKVHKVEADVTHVWTCPYSKAVASATPAMRLVHEGLAYEIVSVIDIDMKHEDVEIQTKRAV